MALAVGSCSASLLGQARDRFLNLACGCLQLARTLSRSDSRPPASASACACAERPSLIRVSSSHLALSGAPPAVAAMSRAGVGDSAGKACIMVLK